MTIDRKEFAHLIDNIKCCYAKEVHNKLPQINDFPIKIFEGENVSFEKLLNSVNSISNVFLKSIILRAISISELRKARDFGLNANIKRIWKFLSESIEILPTNATISSIGSQGFLSIPIFKDDKVKEKFDFIRIHIWDNSLEKLINHKSCENFSIHTHSFFAESWVVCGKVINERFKVDVKDIPTKNSLFTVGYNKSLNEVNQHTSSANNTNTYVDITQISHEVYMQGGNYVIKAGDFHKSGSLGENGLSATIFSFTAVNGLVDQSFVTGPSEIASSEINRKMHIDPTELLKRINDKMNNDD
jgi:hypothetical protein